MCEFSESDIGGVSGRAREYFTSTPDLWRARHMCLHFGEIRRESPYISTSNAIFKTQLLREAGKFNPSLRRCGEDTIISKKVIKLGYRLIYTPEAKCWHMRQDNIFSALKSYWHYHYFGYFQDITLKRTIKSFFFNNIRNTYWLFKEDITRFKLRFIIIDCLFFFIAAINDIYTLWRYKSLHKL